MAIFSVILSSVLGANNSAAQAGATQAAAGIAAREQAKRDRVQSVFNARDRRKELEQQAGPSYGAFGDRIRGNAGWNKYSAKMGG
jgi:hypothetical protein